MKESAIKITLYEVYYMCGSDTISAISLRMKVKRNVREENKVEEAKVN